MLDGAWGRRWGRVVLPFVTAMICYAPVSGATTISFRFGARIQSEEPGVSGAWSGDIEPVERTAWTARQYERFLRSWVTPLIENNPERGVVVGVLDERGQYVFGFGSRQPFAGEPPDGNTVFDIGSVTKVFTSLLLADMIDRGEVAEDDPVTDHLPDHFVVPDYKGRQITLVDLATHTSGLPRNAGPRTRTDPLGAVEPFQLAGFLRHAELEYEPGSEYLYSNLGVGLLGYALAHRLGTSYEEALRVRILDPLGLDDTGISLAGDRSRRLQQGFTPGNYRSLPWAWEYQTLAGAGALRSTTSDMLRFLDALLNAESGSRVARLVELTLRPRRDANGGSIGLGWILPPVGDVAVHDGGTAHHNAFVAWSPSARAGVVLFVNGGTPDYSPAMRLMSAIMGQDFDPRRSLARLSGLPEPLNIRPQVWLNRVHGTYGGLAADLDLGPNLRLSGSGGYSSGTDRWEGRLSVTHQYGNHWDDRISVTLRRGVTTRWESSSKELGSGLFENAFSTAHSLPGLLLEGLAQPVLSNSVAYLLGNEDYFDYFDARGVEVEGGIHLDALGITLRGGIVLERHASVQPQTRFLPGRDAPRVNPAIDEGRLRSGSLTLGWNLTRNPLASVGQKRLLLRLEHSSPDFLASDFDFTTVTGQVDWRINTSRSKPFATNLDVRVLGVTHAGSLPLQRFAVVEPAVRAYDLGALRTLEGRPFEGDQFLGVFWEHNFRGLALETLGLGRPGNGIELIAEGGLARTWLSPADMPRGFMPRGTDGWYHEVGTSVNGILGFLRVGMTKQLDGNGFGLNISSAKPF